MTDTRTDARRARKLVSDDPPSVVERPRTGLHVVIDDTHAVIEVRAGAEFSTIRVARQAAETVSEFFARLGLLAQLSPRQLTGVAHRSTEARKRIAEGRARAGDAQVAGSNAYFVTTRANAASAEQEAHDLAQQLFDAVDRSDS